MRPGNSLQSRVAVVDVGVGCVALVIAVLLATTFAQPAGAADTVTFVHNDSQRTEAGRVLVQAQDGGLLFQTREGAIFNIEPDDIVSHRSDDAPFAPLDADEMAARLLEELPEGFVVHNTARYVICHNTSESYARWCGGLLERLAGAFDNFWSRPPRSLDTHEPEFPLAAIVFGDKASYVEFARDELGDAAESMIGYYSQRTNRIVMYDLTGSVSADQRARLSERQIVRMLSEANAGFTVATIIHEATHQIAYNSGVQTRFADNPVWLTEGMAMYFETPDLGSRSGWRTIGAVNSARLRSFQSRLSKWTAEDLRAIVESDEPFRQTATGPAAYDAAWALNFFLCKRKINAYCEYLRANAKEDPLMWDTPEQRLAAFTEAFGEIDALHAQITRYAARLQARE